MAELNELNELNLPAPARENERDRRMASNQSVLSTKEDDSPSKFWTFSRFKELLADSYLNN